MEFIEFPKIPRYSRECVITEKIDGTNGCIFWDESVTHMLVGSRKRWITKDRDNFGFAEWAFNNFEELKKLGPGRHFGEWWGQGIQRGYGLKEKRFSLFNVKKWEDASIRPVCCSIVPVLFRGMFTTANVEHTLTWLAVTGNQAAPGFMCPEGIIIYHTTGNLLFKKTIEKDDWGKGTE